MLAILLLQIFSLGARPSAAKQKAPKRQIDSSAAASPRFVALRSVPISLGRPNEFRSRAQRAPDALQMLPNGLRARARERKSIGCSGELAICKRTQTHVALPSQTCNRSSCPSACLWAAERTDGPELSFTFAPNSLRTFCTCNLRMAASGPSDFLRQPGGPSGSSVCRC